MSFPILDELKERLDQKRPLPQSVIKNLQDVFRIEWIYHSNAIEGNTLTLLETKVVVEEGITIGGKMLREHFEAINHAEAIDYVEEIVSKQESLTERTLKQLHYLIIKNIDNENAGTYRNVNVRISGSQHNPPHFLQIDNDMRELFQWYEENREELHPVELAALFHFKFVYIHPFADGNGRSARLLMNLILMQHGFPPAIIKANPNDRLHYYDCLEKASIDNITSDFIELVATSVESSLKTYLRAIE